MMAQPQPLHGSTTAGWRAPGMETFASHPSPRPAIRACPRAFCLALTFCLSGCGKPTSRRAPSAHPLPSPALVSKGEPGRFGARLVLASDTGPRTFNPLLALDSASDGMVRLLFSSLVRLD